MLSDVEKSNNLMLLRLTPVATLVATSKLSVRMPIVLPMQK